MTQQLMQNYKGNGKFDKEKDDEDEDNNNQDKFEEEKNRRNKLTTQLDPRHVQNTNEIKNFQSFESHFDATENNDDLMTKLLNG
jgi:hypothetical protein